MGSDSFGSTPRCITADVGTPRLGRTGEAEFVGRNEMFEELLESLDREEVRREIPLRCGLLKPMVEVLRQPERRRDSLFVMNLRSRHAADIRTCEREGGG